MYNFIYDVLFLDISNGNTYKLCTYFTNPVCLLYTCETQVNRKYINSMYIKEQPVTEYVVARSCFV